MRAQASGHGHPGSAPTRRWAALAVLCISLLIVTLDNTVLNVALPTLVEQLGATSSDLQWIVDAYVLAFAGLMLVSGSLADRVGRKRTYLAGLVLFAACSAWAAFSGSVGHLIAARASMGVGAALIMPSTLAIITNTFQDAAERSKAIGLWAATSGAGIALGPIVGGVLLDHFWWGSVFLINVPIALLGAVLAVPLVPDSRNPAADRPDVVGSVLSIAGLGMVLYAIIEAPVRGWFSAVVLATGIGGVAVLGAFAAWERASSHPMLRLEFFRNRRFSAPMATVGLLVFGLFGSLFVLTQFLQFQLGYSALQAGVRMLPAAGAIVVVAPVSARLVARLGTRWTIAGASVLAGAGFWQMSGATTSSTYASVAAGMTLVGIGAGLVIPAATASVMSSLPAEHTGVGSATNGTFLQTGGALGVAVIGSLLSNRFDNRVGASLAPFHLPAAAEDAIRSSMGAGLAVAHRIGGPAGAVVERAVRAAFMSGMQLGMRTAAAVAVLAAIVAVAAVPGRGARRRRPDGLRGRDSNPQPSG